MTSFRLLMFFFTIASMARSPADAEELLAESGSTIVLTRDRRHLFKKKACKKFGICQGGFGGGGYGNQGGYPQPPINIAISQSQSSANGAGGGYSNGYYPNNHQFNGGYPQQGYGGYPHQGGYGSYGGYGGNVGNYGGYPQQGGYGPGYFGNGQGSYNNQFNGNYYGPGGAGGGYGFRPNGPYYDESADEEGGHPGGDHAENEHDDANGPAGAYNDYNQDSGYHNQGQNYAVAGAFAVSARKA